MTALTMRQTAEALGRNYDTFRKGWRDLVDQHGFPAPFLGRTWAAEAVAAWIAARSAPAALVGPAQVRPLAATHAARARARLEDLRAG